MLPIRLGKTPTTGVMRKNDPKKKNRQERKISVTNSKKDNEAHSFTASQEAAKREKGGEVGVTKQCAQKGRSRFADRQFRLPGKAQLNASCKKKRLT